MKVKGDPYREAEQALGPSGELEMTMLLVPMSTYRLVHDQAQKESCTVGQLFEKAILQYLRIANEAGGRVEEKRAKPKPVAVLRRRNNT